mmetsp:Transcript_15314/g.40407  ORF Transcript_15314/g.40407 Transcript_15314/m.40407 type:complete len:257 (-) Transcript_15314:78-848(-)
MAEAHLAATRLLRRRLDGDRDIAVDQILRIGLNLLIHNLARQQVERIAHVIARLGARLKMEHPFRLRKLLRLVQIDLPVVERYVGLGSHKHLDRIRTAFRQHLLHPVGRGTLEGASASHVIGNHHAVRIAEIWSRQRRKAFLSRGVPQLQPHRGGAEIERRSGHIHADRRHRVVVEPPLRKAQHEARLARVGVAHDDDLEGRRRLGRRSREGGRRRCHSRRVERVLCHLLRGLLRRRGAAARIKRIDRGWRLWCCA